MDIPQIDANWILTRQQRRRWEEDPVLWASDVLKVQLWSKQQEILRSVRANRKTAVRSCHEAGKSYTAAVTVADWLDTHRPGDAFVVTSAPTGRQVKAILWREIGRAHTRGGLKGRLNQTEWWMPVGDKEELVAFGQKPADMDPTAFQGIHAKFVLVVFDEACGMTEALWDAADSLIANDAGRILAIGNPDDPGSKFAQICKPGSGWNVIGISAFDTPCFTGEDIPESILQHLVGRTWVEEKRNEWAPDWSWNADKTRCVPPRGKNLLESDPRWLSKVMGLFPSGSGPQSLIPVYWLEQALERHCPPTLPNELGVDCGAGGDATTIAHRQGQLVTILSEDRNPDTMQTVGKIVAERKRTGASLIKVDKIGIGAGVVDRLNEVGEPVVGINVGQAACNKEAFLNVRAENWWWIRERFERGEIGLDRRDTATASELGTIRYKRTSRGQIQIESKDEARRRGVPSPNRADAVMLAMCPPPPPPEPEKRAGLVW